MGRGRYEFRPGGPAGRDWEGMPVRGTPAGIYDERGGLCFECVDPSAQADGELLAAAPDLLVERDELKAVNADLLEALERWTRADGGGVVHLGGCAYGEGGPCDCGLDDARAAVARARGTTTEGR